MGQNKLTYMLNLLDDDSAEVRDEIWKQLANYGLSLEEDLENSKIFVDSDKLNLITPLLENNRKTWIFKNWDRWFYLDSNIEKLETSLNILSKFHYGINFKPDLTNLLDSLAVEFQNKIPYGDEIDLSLFLFQEKQLSGVHDDFNNPFNSNPIYTILEGRGLPITLSLIFILIGDRLGYSIRGCNFPGHFLAKIEIDEEVVFIDCFNHGRIIYENDLLSILQESADDYLQIIKSDTSAEQIIRRVLNNLINSYSVLNDEINRQFFIGLLNKINI